MWQLFFFLAVHQGLWDPSTLSRDLKHHHPAAPTLEEQRLNHWTTREFPSVAMFSITQLT